jgi:hypothetical protein
MADTAREIDVEVDDAEALVAAFTKAIEEGEEVLWVTDQDGRRHGLVVCRIVYIDVEAEKVRPGIGFSNA